MKDLPQSARETARWVLAHALYHGAGLPVSERVLASVLEAVPVHCTGQDLRAHLHYLEQCGLILTQRHPSGDWTAHITQGGVDVVEYNREAPAGIARPAKYW